MFHTAHIYVKIYILKCQTLFSFSLPYLLFFISPPLPTHAIAIYFHYSPLYTSLLLNSILLTFLCFIVQTILDVCLYTPSLSSSIFFFLYSSGIFLHYLFAYSRYKYMDVQVLLIVGNISSYAYIFQRNFPFNQSFWCLQRENQFSFLIYFLIVTFNIRAQLKL